MRTASLQGFQGILVLDANVLIAFLDSTDVHHTRALHVLEQFVAVGYSTSVLTLAEALVYPTLAGAQDRAFSALERIELAVVPLDGTDALELARVRAQYHVRMPDAVALHAALSTRSTLATFDTSLSAAATLAGVETVGIQPA
ncbi:type II toxin-antitoxin system VapC family toxin [Subtercola endophyticus]|uniref:type II toxin-antitoxin system VapC family toxin n=1 Tax=Subtercola endophyticus TaxID=2895559 RepID=UPI001E5DBDA9|nr:PIN domain-containing protein [Subtercola endophyticus]UFS59266.1 PIN domain-containing protein [Subtercola endophyticus]